MAVSFGDSGGWKEEELIRVEYLGCVAGSVGQPVGDKCFGFVGGGGREAYVKPVSLHS